LRENAIGVLGAECLRNLLENTFTLENLRASATGIGELGCQIIAGALIRNTSLHTLDLSGNAIGNAGWISLATIIGQGQNNTLCALILQNNNINDEIAPELAAMIETNTNMMILDLSGNSFSYEGAQLVALAIKHNSDCNLYKLSGIALRPHIDLLGVPASGSVPSSDSPISSDKQINIDNSAILKYIRRSRREKSSRMVSFKLDEDEY